MDYRRIIVPVSVTAFTVNFILFSLLKWEIINYWFYIELVLAIMPIVLLFSFIKLKKNSYLFILWLVLFLTTFGYFWFLKKELGIFEFSFASFAPIIATFIMLYYAIVCFLLSCNVISKKNNVLGYYTKMTKEYEKELFNISNRNLSIMYFVCVILEIIMIFYLDIAFKYFGTLLLLLTPYIVTYINEKYLYNKIKKTSV